jgi:hypothetical protein
MTWFQGFQNRTVSPGGVQKFIGLLVYSLKDNNIKDYNISSIANLGHVMELLGLV